MPARDQPAVAGSDGPPVRLSRFAHFIEAPNGYVGILNALNLGVVIVDAETARQLVGASSLSLEPALVEALTRQRLLVSGKTAPELNDLAIAREHLKHSCVGILYLLLDDRCNIQCRYCYVENAMPAGYRHSAMDEATAVKGIDTFRRTLAHVPTAGLEEPQIILYGGEPLMNWPLTQRVLYYVRSLKESGQLPSATSVTINTNGTLVSPAIAAELARYASLTVAVSVDGPREIHDLQRVSHRGTGTFDQVDRGIRLLEQAGVNVGLCCTLASHNVDSAEQILRWLTERYGVQSLGFNILIGVTPEESGADYAEKVANKLIACFQWAREQGIYEDRVMRKVRSFVEGRVYLYDCGGCGQQMVVTPDGQVGVCQAYCGTRRYFVPLTADFDPAVHPIWQEWRRRSPIGMGQCIDCIALGNCGGGCPYTAERLGGNIWALDEGFCVFSRKIIEFLVRDLVRVSTSGIQSSWESPLQAMEGSKAGSYSATRVPVQ
jgi:Arylsulfatase regulator (Fe-S oxidoreductase)